MSCFTKREFVNKKFPKLSAEVKELKTTEGGLGAVCKVMEEYENIARQEGKAEGKVEGISEGIGIGRIRTLCELVHDGSISIQDAARKAGLTEEKFLKEMELAGFEPVKSCP